MILQCNYTRGDIWITVYNLNENQVAYVKFIQGDGYISSASVMVDEDYRNQGIATAMYMFAHELGHQIKPSVLQSPPGQKMWKSFRARKLPFAKETFLERLTRVIKEIIIKLGF